MAVTLADDLLPLPFSEGVLDRASDLRRDRNQLSVLWRHRDSRVMFVRNSHEVALDALGTLRWERTDSLGEYSEAETVFLGLGEGRGALFAYCGSPQVGGSGKATNGVRFQGLREAALELGPVDQEAAVLAVALATWHARSLFCPACGAKTQPADGGHVRRCAGCGQDAFPRSDAAVIMLVSDEDRCVLGRRHGSPPNRWSTLAGFVEAGESPEAAVRREVFEEVGLKVDRVRYRGSQPWPFPASLMLAFDAHAPFETLVMNEEHLEVRWFARTELSDLLASGELAAPSKLSAGGRLIEAWLGQGA